MDRYIDCIMRFVMRWVEKSFLAVIIAAVLVLPGCSACESPSAEIVGEWEAEDFILDASAGEINGKPYLFLMTMGTNTVMKATIHVLNVDDPAEPSEIATLETPMEILAPVGGLVLSGTELYVAGLGEPEGALWVVDVSDPALPREITLITTDSVEWRPCVSGDILAMAAMFGRYFAFFDISRPTEPSLLGELELAPRPISVSNWHADYVGDMFYVVDKDGLAIVDASSPDVPQEVGFYTNPDWEPVEPEGVEGAGTTVIYSTEDFDSLIEMFEDMYNPGSFLDVAVSDGYAYIAATDSGLIVLDVGDPESVEEVARLEIQGKAICVLVAGNLAYIVGVSYTGGNTVDSFHYGIHIVNISDPLAPELTDSIDVVDTFPPWQTVIALGDYIYFTDYQTMYVIDIYGGCR